MSILIILSILLVYFDLVLVQIPKRNEYEKEPDIDRMSTLFYSIIVNTFVLLMANEAISLFNGISYLSVLVTWLMTNIIAIIFLVHICRQKKISRDNLVKFFNPISRASFSVLNVFLIIICLIAVLIAVLTVPYNWDSMTYHLTRIAHWIQNGSVAHYVCHDINQSASPPLAEFVNLHVYILSGNSDTYVNLLQAFSLILTVVGTYKISIKIGCNRLFASLASLVYATTPIVFAEALGTQVDLYAAFWVLVFVDLIVDFVRVETNLEWNRGTIYKLVLMGISAGFCYLAKPSGCIAGVVFAMWLLVRCIRRKDQLLIIIKSVVVVCISAVITILPELIRNIMTFHAISSKETSTDFLVKSLDIRYLISNMIQNIGYNLNNTFIDMSELIDKLIFKPIYILYAGEIPQIFLEFKLMSPTKVHHDYAVNPIITWLMILAICGSCIIYIIRRKNRCKEKVFYGYAWASVIAFIVFCTLVKWNRFVTRYEVGYFVLLAPAIMLLFQYVFNRKKEAEYAFAGIIGFVCALSMIQLVDYHKDYVTMNQEVRIERYFESRWLYPQYSEIVNLIKTKDYRNVGFICGIDSYEYPFFKMLEGDIERFEHVYVTNETSKYMDVEFVPECIIVVDVDIKDTIEFNSNIYELVNNVSGVRLYVNSSFLQ